MIKTLGFFPIEGDSFLGLRLHQTNVSSKKEEKRIHSLEDADNKESNKQLLWSLGALSLGFVIILIIYL